MNFTKEFNGCKTTVTFVSYPTVIIKVTKSTTAITRQYYKRKIYDTKGKKKIIKKQNTWKNGSHTILMIIVSCQIGKYFMQVITHIFHKQSTSGLSNHKLSLKSLISTAVSIYILFACSFL